jgi:hypothetical protein
VQRGSGSALLRTPGSDGYMPVRPELTHLVKMRENIQERVAQTTS